MTKTYDCFVCETKEVRRFTFRSDADEFAVRKTAQGCQVLRAVGHVQDEPDPEPPLLGPRTARITARAERAENDRYYHY